MENTVLIIHVVLAFLIIILVLLQKSEGGGLGIGGSQSGGFMTSRGTANTLTKITTIVGALFFITSILLAILSGSNYKPSISQEIKIDATKENNSARLNQPYMYTGWQHKKIENETTWSYKMLQAALRHSNTS